MSDSIIAIDINSGRKAWSFQSEKNDIWNGSCVRNGINCDFDVGSNFDFGASPLLIRNENRGDLILAGQKSGKLPVPLVVIPQGLDDEVIDDLASRAN